MADRTVAVELIARVQSYKANLATANAATKEFRGELDQMRQNSKHNFDQLELGVAGAGAALMGLVGWATKVGMEFDKQMSEVQAITNATATEMGTLRQAALDAGQATVFSATDAAKAEAELAKAGLSTADILGGALDGALSLAAAGSLDLAEAAEIAAKTMGQFQLSGKDVGHVADLLAGAANASATDVHDLGEALKMGGGAAHAAGMSVEDTTTVLTAFAKQALVGSDAGTSLKTMLMMLEAPTQKSADKMKELGLNVYDSNGNMVDAYAIAGQLKTSLSGLTQEQRNAAIVTIFGADAQRAANALYALGSDGLHQLNKDMLAQADAARVAQQKTNNLSGDVERLKGSLESLSITAQSGSTGPLRLLVQALDSLVGDFSALPVGVQQSVFILAGLTGGGLLAAVAFMKVRTATGEMMAAMEAAGPISARMATGLSNATKWAGRASLAFAALGIATTALDGMTGIEVDATGLADAVAELGKSGAKSGELLRLFGKDMAGIEDDAKLATSGFASTGRALESIIPGLKQLNQVTGETSFQEATDNFKQLDSVLAEMARGGNIEGARAAYFRLMQAAHLSADQMEQLTPQYQNATAEAEKNAAATNKQALAAAVAKDSNIKLAGAFGEAASEANGLINKFNELNGGELSWRQAERDAEAAVDDLTQKLKESNGSLSVHTEKGRAAAAAVDAVAEAAGKAAQAKMNETGSVTDANAVYQGYIQKLRDTLAQAGYTKKEIDDLISSIASMPSSKVVTITANVRVNQAQLNKVENQLSRYGNAMANGGILSYAGGGTYEDHTAQIAPAGAMRQWAEPETGGEAYIPLSAQKRSRSVATLAEVDRRFGHPLSGGGGTTQVELIVTPARGAEGKVMSAITEGLRFDVRTISGGSAQVHLGPRGRG